jgi:hypothetical protein
MMFGRRILGCMSLSTSGSFDDWTPGLTAI